MHYTYEEGDPRIQQSTYKGNFKLDVRDPMKLSMIPSVLQLCKGERGSLKVQVSGGFKLLEETVAWKYGASEKRITKEISFEDPVFELSADLKKITIKEIKKNIWIRVEGSSYSGTVNATGQFKVRGKCITFSVFFFRCIIIILFIARTKHIFKNMRHTGPSKSKNTIDCT